MTNSLAPYVSMILGSLSFAVMATMTHALRERCDWHVVALLRAFFALLFTALFALSAGVQLFVWKPRRLWIRSIAGSFSLICTFYALSQLPAANVVTLTNMFPLWVALFSWPLLGERPTLGVGVAVLMGVIGVALIQQPHLAKGNYTATFVALAGSVFTAIAMIGLHRLKGIDPRAVIVHFSAVGMLFCIVAFLFGQHSHPLTDLLEESTLFMLLGVGIAATIGQFFLTKAFTFAAPARVAVVSLTQIVFALGIELWLWQRPVDSTALLGIGMVIAPTAWLMTHRA